MELPVDGSTGNPLIGVWELERADPALDLDAGALMMFLPAGELRYGVPSGENLQVMLLSYRVEGEFIVTNQPSAPREERTRFCLHDENQLELDYGGASAWFRRAAR